jgi:uncharacterized protein (TIGR00369 family)
MENSNENLTTIVSTVNNQCFGCGPANSTGLQLEFSAAPGDVVVCDTAIPNSFESYPGYLHGGIIATLLDEVMSKAVCTHGVSAMTRQMEIEYLRPVPSGKPIRLEGRVLRSEGRNYWVNATVSNSRGTALALAKGHFIQVRSR